jgi:hypothetical protein
VRLALAQVIHREGAAVPYYSSACTSNGVLPETGRVCVSSLQISDAMVQACVLGIRGFTVVFWVMISCLWDKRAASNFKMIKGDGNLLSRFIVSVGKTAGTVFTILL